MQLISQLLQNKVLIASAAAWLIAQGLKTLIYVFLNRQFTAERLVGGGGMPSSHSSTVCALATASAIQYGPSGFEFAVSAVLALVVMYDAIGVRQETGKQARLLNNMVELFSHMGEPMEIEKQLKEFVGHTPLQVLVGAILGILTAFILMG